MLLLNLLFGEYSRFMPMIQKGFKILITTRLPKYEFQTLSIGVASDFYHDITALFQKTYVINTTIFSIPRFYITFSFQSIAASTVAHGKARGRNTLGVAEKAQRWLCLTNTGAPPSGDQVTLPLSISFMKRVVDMAKAKGRFELYLFLNDAGIDQKVIATYGDAQVKELVKVSKKYDSKGVFQKLTKGGFTLP